jgi:hypothetical protein
MVNHVQLRFATKAYSIGTRSIGFGEVKMSQRKQFDDF